MKIVWDEPKRIANLAKHGFDFAAFETSFDLQTALERPAHPSRSGRSRSMLIGWWDDDLVVAAVISPLGREAVSLVSLRVASESERDLYERS